MLKKSFLLIIIYFIIVSTLIICFLVNTSLYNKTTLVRKDNKFPILVIPVAKKPALEKPVFFNQSPQEGLIEALDYYRIEHPKIVYAQAILETGYFKSYLCVAHNNLFGLYNSKKKRYFKFNHWTESVKAYKNMVQRRYKPPENYYSFLKRIRYARDTQYTKKLKKLEQEYDKSKQDTSSSSSEQIGEEDGSSSENPDYGRQENLYSFR